MPSEARLKKKYRKIKEGPKKLKLKMFRFLRNICKKLAKWLKNRKNRRKLLKNRKNRSMLRKIGKYRKK